MGTSSELERPGNVYWIGGSPCSGKSSLSCILAERYNLALYSIDAGLDHHLERLDPQRHPCLAHWQEMSWEERWMRPVHELLAEVIGCYSEHFSLVLEEVLAYDPEQTYLVEGTALLPDLVSQWIPEPHKAIWVIPTPSFQRQYYALRPWARSLLSTCSDPEAAFEHWMERDSRFSDWVAQRVRQLGLNLLIVDGSRTITENAGWAAERLKLDLTKG